MSQREADRLVARTGSLVPARFADHRVNDAESLFLVALSNRRPDARALRHGWPDFLICDGARTFGVEVKSNADPLNPAQLAMCEALEAAGIDVYVWHTERPSAFIQWRRYDVAKPARELRREREAREAAVAGGRFGGLGGRP